MAQRPTLLGIVFAIIVSLVGAAPAWSAPPDVSGHYVGRYTDCTGGYSVSVAFDVVSDGSHLVLSNYFIASLYRGDINPDLSFSAATEDGSDRLSGKFAGNGSAMHLDAKNGQACPGTFSATRTSGPPQPTAAPASSTPTSSPTPASPTSTPRSSLTPPPQPSVSASPDGPLQGAGLAPLGLPDAAETIARRAHCEGVGGCESALDQGRQLVARARAGAAGDDNLAMTMSLIAALGVVADSEGKAVAPAVTAMLPVFLNLYKKHVAAAKAGDTAGAEELQNVIVRLAGLVFKAQVDSYP